MPGGNRRSSAVSTAHDPHSDLLLLILRHRFRRPLQRGDEEALSKRERHLA